ncbi:MAG: hypothetical protein AB7S75_14645 [Desulfococcaceae bacterium]
MKRDDLIQSAGKIAQASPEAAAEYAQKKELLVARLNEIMQQRPDILELVGEKNMEMMKDNHSNHARFVASILRYFNAEVLTDTVLWVFRSYRSRGFHQNYWAAQINAWIEILRQELSPESFASVYPLYEWFSVNIPAFSNISDIQLRQTPGHDF